MTISDYTLCIDGGGSKTVLQILDREGHILDLTKGGVKSDRIVGAGSNINSIGSDQFRSLFEEMFRDVQVGDDLRRLSDIIDKCSLVAGMAGLGIGPSVNKERAAAVFRDLGVSQMRLFSDAEMGLELIRGDGAILIAGTGSICLGKKDGKLFRVGGLGWRVGDEGSAYQIGLQALRAALAYEYGFGEETALTEALRNFYKVAEIRSLIGPLNSLQDVMPPAKIASCARIVTEMEGDPVATRIVEQAAASLNQLVATMLKISNLVQGEIHLYGGCFKSRLANQIVSPIGEIQNMANQNPAVLFAWRSPYFTTAATGFLPDEEIGGRFTG